MRHGAAAVNPYARRSPSGRMRFLGRFLANFATVTSTIEDPIAAPAAPCAVSAAAPVAAPVAAPSAAPDGEPPRRMREIGGRDGPDPTRYGDWEKNGRCIDF